MSDAVGAFDSLDLLGDYSSSPPPSPPLAGASWMLPEATMQAPGLRNHMHVPDLSHATDLPHGASMVFEGAYASSMDVDASSPPQLLYPPEDDAFPWGHAHPDSTSESPLTPGAYASTSIDTHLVFGGARSSARSPAAAAVSTDASTAVAGPSRLPWGSTHSPPRSHSSTSPPQTKSLSTPSDRERSSDDEDDVPLATKLGIVVPKKLPRAVFLSPEKRKRRLTERAMEMAHAQEEEWEEERAFERAAKRAVKGRGAVKAKGVGNGKGKGKGKEGDEETTQYGSLAEVPTSCHQCHNKTLYEKMQCTVRTKNDRRCGKRYCDRCIELRCVSRAAHAL